MKVETINLNTYSLQEKIKEIEKIGIRKKERFYLLKFFSLFIIAIILFTLVLLYLQILLGSDNFFILIFLIVIPSTYVVVSKFIYDKFHINFFSFIELPLKLYDNYTSKQYQKLRHSYYRILRRIKQIQDVRNLTFELGKNFRKMVELDKQISGIDPLSLDETKQALNNLKESLSMYSQTIYNLDKKKKYFSQYFKDRIIFLEKFDEIIFNEKKFLLELNELNYSVVKLWLLNHELELELLEKEIIVIKNTTNSIEGKSALEIETVRLEKQIENIKNLQK